MQTGIYLPHSSVDCVVHLVDLRDEEHVLLVAGKVIRVLGR